MDHPVAPPPSPRPPCELVGHPHYPTPSLWLCSSCTVGIVAENSSRFITPPRQRPFRRCRLTMSRGGHRRRHHIAHIRHTVIGRSRTVYSRDPARLDSTRPLFSTEVFSSRALPEKVTGRSLAVIGGHRRSSEAVVSREKFSSHLCAVCRPVRSTAQLNSAKSPP